MKRVFYLLTIVMLLITSDRVSAQNVFDVNDPDVIFTSSNQPPEPSWNMVSKWGHTVRLNWNPYNYGFKSYIFRGMAFRLKFPKTYAQGVNDGKKYPLFLFLHGLGEYAPIYDNELQLVHGGQTHAQHVDNLDFDGFLVYPQSRSGYLQSNMQNLSDLIDSLVKYAKVNEDRVVLGGLSSGGQAVLDFLETVPKEWAAVTPISAARTTDLNYVSQVLSVPIWLANGGQDKGPYPSTVTDLVNKYNELGGDVRQSFYPTLGHGVWNNFWAEPGYFDYLRNAHKAQPVVLFKHNEFCPGDPIDAEFILQPGFYQYEWQKDEVTIPDATSSTYHATSFGTYRARFKRTASSEWSEWSPRPIVVAEKTATITPPISVDGLHSYVLPATDGSTTVPLKVPEGYETYEWRRVSDNALVSSASTYNAPIGEYKVRVTEKFGCSSVFSDAFKVVNAVSSGVPDKATNVTAITLSNTSIEIYWNENPAPAFSEDAYEIYRSKTSGGNYELAGIVPADSLSFIDVGLLPNVKYFYVVRAINNNGASALSNETFEVTKSDITPPVSPANLRVVSTYRHSIKLNWEESTDDVGIKNYDIYINGAKAYTTTNTEFTVNNLDSFKTYSFYVIAKDLSGNKSVPSGQVTGFTKYSGFDFSVYQGEFSALPDFSALTSVYDGHNPTIDLGVSPFNTNYGMVWSGYIYIPTNGTYTFYIDSDDGAAIYLKNHYGPGITPFLINPTYGGKNKAVTLTKGVYPIGITFYQGAGAQGLTLSWKCSTAGFPNKTVIPAQYFGDQNTAIGTAPAQPSNLLATPLAYNKVKLTWTDNSTNETGFELYRRKAGESLYQMIGLLNSNATSFTDSLVEGGSTYSYKIQAVSPNGQSGFNFNDLSGVTYEYFEGTWDNLPDFNSLTPVATGNLDNFSITPRLRDDNFAFRFSGTINIPTTGNYTFYTTSDDGSKLYIDNFNTAGTVVNNDGLHGSVEAQGTKTLTAGPHKIYVTFFEKGGAELLQVKWAGPGIAKQVIAVDALKNTRTTITTPDAPPVPDVPVNLNATVVSKNQIDFSFSSNSPVIGYEIVRSLGTNQNFRLFKVLNTTDNNIVVNDSSLYPNSICYYKVRAMGVSGNSAFSNEVFGKTLNSSPSIIELPTQYVYYSGNTIIPIKAVDDDGDILTFNLGTLPDFVTFTPTTNGNGNLIFNPTPVNLGTYSINVEVTDGNGGTDSKSFEVNVTNNRKPKLGRIRDLSVDEGGTGLINITAVDPDRRSKFNFQFKGAPEFSSMRVGEDGSVTAFFSPGYADAGNYSFWVIVSDGLGGIDSSIVNVTVNNVDPVSQKLYINILNNGSTPVPGVPWNNITGYSTSSLKDNNGQTTGIGLVFNTNKWNTFNLGAVTQNNSGLYPDAVLRDYYFFGSFNLPDTVEFTLSGLEANSKYNLSAFASTTYTTGSTVYESNGQTKQLDPYNNSSNQITFYGLQTDGSGNLTVKMSKAADASIGYLNAIVLQRPYDDGTAPATPKNFTASPLSNGNILLQWKDIAYNEYGYSILRSHLIDGPYTVLNEGASNANDTVFVDNTSVGNTSYYYKLVAFNDYGNSDTVLSSVVTSMNRNPILPSLTSIFLKTGSDTTFIVKTVDDPGENLIMDYADLPSFVTVTELGNGEISLQVRPKSGDKGFYQNLKIGVHDSFGGTAYKTFSITVTDSAFRSVFINFGPPDASAEPAPWNNYLSFPFGSLVMNNLLDDANINSGYSFRFMNNLNGTNNTGMPAYGKGIYPDNVIRSSVYTNSSSPASFQFGNLDPSKKYNIVIFSSLNSGAEDSASFTSGSQTVYTNGRYNVNKSAQLNGLSPNGSGIINVSFTKTTNSEYLNINAIELQEYSGTPLTSPSNLYALSNLSNNSIKLIWSDRTDQENNYEIYRSSSLNGSYTLIGTVGSNITSYTDNSSSLVAGETYYYKVRSKRNTTTSDYSNVAFKSLAKNIVLLNLNAETTNHEALPWNNTDDGPSSEGFVISDLVNTDFQNTGIQMEITKEFNGKGFAGVSTPGILPYNVMFTNYWTDASQVSQVKFSNLDQRKKYRIGVFNSVDRYGFYVGNYTVNGIVRSINGYKNGTTMIYFDDITPDENGEVIISVTPDPASPYTFTNAFTIEGYEPLPEQESLLRNSIGNEVTGIELTNSQIVNQNGLTVYETGMLEINVYPNPFVSALTAQIKLPVEIESATLELYDIQSRVISRKQLENKGGIIQSIQIPVISSLSPGTYFLKLSANGKQMKSVKIVKAQ